MTQFSPSYAGPLVLDRSTEAQVYGLFALAMGLTVTGVFIGMQFASTLLSTGMYIVLLIAELAILFTSSWWVERSPLNVLMFALFPILSGLTFTPYAIMLLTGYVNGPSILLNAFAATACMSTAAAVFARTTSWNLSFMGRALFLGLLGLLALGILQIFVPALQTTQMELILSGAGVILFAGFTAYDLQRIQALSRSGASPFLLALSLYLDIFNLFISIVRFMTALSGERR